MPVEVISLLSSSEAGSPPHSPPPPPPRQTKRQPHQPHLPPAALLSDDILSLTTSPPRNKNPTPSWNWDNLNSKPDDSAAADKAWVLSDDEFAPSGNISRSTYTSNDGPIPKRRRLGQPDQNATSSDHGLVRAPRPAAGSRSEPLQALALGRLNATAGRLEPARLSRLNAERSEPRIPCRDDPFASSSPREKEQRHPEIDGQRMRQQLSYSDDDPFASPAPREKQNKPVQSRPRSLIVDDIDPFASSSPGLMSRPLQSPRTAALWDPISSSAPLPAAADNRPANPPRSFRKTQSEVITLDDSEDDCVGQAEYDDDFPDISGLNKSKHKFASVTKLPAASASSKPPKKPKPTGMTANSTEPKKSSEEKARGREEKAAAREAEKERKRLEKERAKEERAHEKARATALAEVNKIRTDKKVSTPEMIVDLPATLDDTVKFQAETLLRDLDVHSISWASPIENVVKWRRKVVSRYSDERGHWEPVPERIEREDYAMVIVPAAQFVDLVLGEGNTNLESHVLRMRRHFPNDTIIYLLEGLTPWLRKNRNLRNRQFVSTVRSGLEQPNDPPSSSQAQAPNSRPRRPNTPQTYIDEDSVEDALLQLQVLHGALIHHTATPLETARWIAVFTQHISTVPYRRQRDAANDAGFCMETGQVRTGEGPRDTYVRMLQEIGRVTAPIAYGIAGEFGSVPKLVRRLEDGGPLVLEKVRKSVNKEGEVSERAVGQAVSRRVHKIFLGRDEESMDI